MDTGELKSRLGRILGERRGRRARRLVIGRSPVGCVAWRVANAGSPHCGRVFAKLGATPTWNGVWTWAERWAAATL